MYVYLFFDKQAKRNKHLVVTCLKCQAIKRFIHNNPVTAN
jgi:RNase P subunit RPR2